MKNKEIEDEDEIRTKAGGHEGSHKLCETGTEDRSQRKKEEIKTNHSNTHTRLSRGHSMEIAVILSPRLNWPSPKWFLANTLSHSTSEPIPLISHFGPLCPLNPCTGEALCRGLWGSQQSLCVCRFELPHALSLSSRRYLLPDSNSEQSYCLILLSAGLTDMFHYTQTLPCSSEFLPVRYLLQIIFRPGDSLTSFFSSSCYYTPVSGH